MQSTDRERFQTIFNYLSLNFPERDVSPELADSYFNDLSEYSIEEISGAATLLVKTGWHFPFVSDFIRALSPDHFPGKI